MQEGVTTRKRRREEISTPVVSSSVITASNVTDASSVPVHVPEPEPVVIEQPRYETVLADKLEQPSSHVVDIKTENNLSEMISDTMTDETKHIVLPLLSGAESHTNKESSITTHLVDSTSNQNQINSVQDTKHSSSATTTTTTSTSMSTRSDSHGILSNAVLSSSTTAAAAASASVPSLPTGTEVYMSAAQATSAIYSRSINPFSTQFALATLSWAPLHLASLKGDISLVRALCSSGVHINARTVTDGKTALAIAVEQGFIAIVDELLQRGGAM
jgi:hypothetical protein